MATINGTSNFDILTGTSDADVIAGLAGDDFIDGLGGADRMDGGTGNDVFIVDDPGDVVIERAGQGTDEIRTFVSYRLPQHVENLTLLGNAPINGTGNSLNNTITGNDAANVIRGGGGADVFIGGGGNDTYYVDGTVEVVDGGYIFREIDRVVELPGGGTDTVVSNIDYRLADNVENLRLTGTLDLAGFGNSGNNQLIGNAGSNLLVGGDGDDWLDGGAGADHLNGGNGNDTYVIDNPRDSIAPESPFAIGGVDLVRSSISFTLPHSIENLTLTGTANINGTGNSGNNIIRGNSGSNILSGGGGHDTLHGGAGGDWLEGGSGRDVLFGGGGADQFVFDDLDFAGLTPESCDRIQDFKRAEGDKIRLDAVDANRLVEGDQEFQFIGTSGFNKVAGELRYEVISGNTYLLGDVNGDGAADFMVRLDGTHTITVEDLII